jgi:hypothetical protein
MDTIWRTLALVLLAVLCVLSFNRIVPGSACVATPTLQCDCNCLCERGKEECACDKLEIE